MDILVTGTIAFLLAECVKVVLGFGFPIIALVVLTLQVGLLDKERFQRIFLFAVLILGAYLVWRSGNALI